MMVETLTSREMDILQLMGQGISNRDIANQLVITLGTARWYTKQIYSKLGVHSRTEAVIRAAQLGLLEDQISPMPSARSQLPAVHLPEPLTSLVGREADLQAVCDRLATARLVTLTGPGGVGKTRLAISAAHDLADDFADGVCFVDLSPVRDAALVADAICSALDLRPPEDAVAFLRKHLSERQELLVLDNFEQIIAAAPLIGDLVKMAPHTRWLVTSRESLKIYGEHEYQVRPLDVPAQTATQTPESARQYEAVALFVQRAQSIRADFELTTDNASTVSTICARLDGLPLAIELAATRIKLFTPDKLLKHLDQRFKTLVTAQHGVPDRQRALRAAIAWSYDLLTPEEQIVLARMSVFVGGANLDAIERICAAALEMDSLATVESLLNKSLLQQSEDPLGEPRFTLLETIRAYVSDQLNGTDDAHLTAQRHAHYFVDLVEQAQPFLRALAGNIWMQRLEIEHDNLRATLQWACQHDPALTVQLVGALDQFFYYRGYHAEAHRWIERIVPVMDVAPLAYRARFLVCAGRIACLEQDQAQAAAYFRQAVALTRQSGDQIDLAWALGYFASNYIADPAGYADGMALAEQSLELFTQLDHKSGLALVHNIVGELARAVGDDARARTAYETCLQFSREIGETLLVAMNLQNLGYLAYHAGDFHEAERLMRSSTQIGVDLQDNLDIACSLGSLTGPLAANGDPALGAQILGAVERWMDEHGASPQPGDAQEIAVYIADMRAQLGDKVYETLYAAGRALSLQEALDLAGIDGE